MSPLKLRGTGALRSSKSSAWIVACAAATLSSTANAYTNCVVAFGLGNSPALSTAQVTIDYSLVQGTFGGSDGDAACTSSVAANSITAKNSCTDGYGSCQWGTDRKAIVAIISSSSFTGPAELFKCNFLSAQSPEPLDFKVSIDAATSAESVMEISPQPYIDILSIDCGSN